MSSASNPDESHEILQGQVGTSTNLLLDSFNVCSCPDGDFPSSEELSKQTIIEMS